MKNLGCVIFDEVHYINDQDRGTIWEEAITMLDKNITLVLLSATIENALQFAQWIGTIKQKPIVFVTTPKRVIPLSHFVFLKKELYLIQDKDEK